MEHNVIPIDQLYTPEWYCKQDVESAVRFKLTNSIKRYGYGVIIVNVSFNGCYDIIDGNTRVDILKEMGYKEVHCEMHKLSEWEAIIFSYNLNRHWSEEHIIKFSRILVDRVLPYISPVEMSNFVPESVGQINSLMNLCTFEWEKHLKTDNNLFDWMDE